MKEQTELRLVPDLVQDPSTEELVIGFLLKSYEGGKDQIMSRLSRECFHTPKLRCTYEVMQELLNRDEPLDMMHVYMQLTTARREAEVTAGDLADWESRADTTNVTQAIELLHQLKVRRAMQTLAEQIKTLALDMTVPVTQTVESALTVLDSQEVSFSHQGVSLHELMPLVQQRIDDNRNPQTLHHGPYTGIPEIDDMGGLPETGLTVVAAGPSQGKSAFASAIVLQSAQHGMPAGYFSLEMTNQDLLCRMSAMEGGGTSAANYMYNRLSDDTYHQVLHDIGRLDERYGRMVWFDDSRTTRLDDICNGIRYMVRTHGIRLAIVDFLQLLNFTMGQGQRNTTTEQLMGQASRRLKNLADQLGISVIALCQINRSSEQSRPWLNTLRDSGQIAEAADMVLFVWRPEQYGGQYDKELARYDPHGTAALLIAKNRMGRLQDVLCGWDGARTLIYPLTPEQRRQRQVSVLAGLI